MGISSLRLILMEMDYRIWSSRNTDPAPEQNFKPVIALKNQLEGNSLTVALHSEQGNTDGLGARVTVHMGDKISHVRYALLRGLYKQNQLPILDSVKQPQLIR